MRCRRYQINVGRKDQLAECKNENERYTIRDRVSTVISIWVTRVVVAHARERVRVSPPKVLWLAGIIRLDVRNGLHRNQIHRLGDMRNEERLPCRWRPILWIDVLVVAADRPQNKIYDHEGENNKAENLDVAYNRSEQKGKRVRGQESHPQYAEVESDRSVFEIHVARNPPTDADD